MERQGAREALKQVAADIETAASDASSPEFLEMKRTQREIEEGLPRAADDKVLGRRNNF